MSELEKDRLQLLADAEINFKGDMQDKFGPGTYGWHELLDRAFMTQTMWEDFVAQHPSCCLDSLLFALADDISTKLAEFYLAVGNKDAVTRTTED